MHENRETSLVPDQAGRSGKANNHKPDTNAREESDCAVVCAEQRIAHDGLSPSCARMRSAVSERGG
jgi:hypothetical protein